MAKAAAKATGTSRNAPGKVAGGDAPRPLPDTREQLLVLHDVARRKRDAAPLESHERVAAAREVERIEVHIARIERAMDPPLV